MARCQCLRNKDSVRNRTGLQKTPFPQHFLSLSRACLGKMVVFRAKWRKRCVFRTVQSAEHSPCPEPSVLQGKRPVSCGQGAGNCRQPGPAEMCLLPLNFSCVRPEPVLVNIEFLGYSGAKKTFSHRSGRLGRGRTRNRGAPCCHRSSAESGCAPR